MKIRVSLATSSLLKLKNYAIKVKPTTLYFLLAGECKGNCLYCEQKKGKLARVKWPEFDFEKVKEKIKNVNAKRICILGIYNHNFINEIAEIVRQLKTELPISACINAVGIEEMKILKEVGIERIGIGLDCFSKRIFNKWKKGVPSWNDYIKAIENAKKIFGKVSCHLIAGLGENDREAINLMKELAKKEIKISLFAYVEKNETKIDISRYRVLQIARYFIEKNKGKFYFDDSKLVEIEVPSIPKETFMTSGCPYCNRPFYNERVTKIYNYPYELSNEEYRRAIKEAEKYARIHTVD